MKQKVNPAVAAVIVAVVLIGLGIVGMKLYTNGSDNEAKPMAVKITDPDDPKYRPDPALSGGR